MKIPSGEHAQVSDEKVRDYLLSPEHPIGRYKAAFFSALGYRRDDAIRLQEDLKAVAASGEISWEDASPYGTKYMVRGTLISPMRRKAEIVTVWIVLVSESVPRFVTAYPL